MVKKFKLVKKLKPLVVPPNGYRKYTVADLGVTIELTLKKAKRSGKDRLWIDIRGGNRNTGNWRQSVVHGSARMARVCLESER